jgi:hypothetical protein
MRDSILLLDQSLIRKMKALVGTQFEIQDSCGVKPVKTENPGSLDNGGRDARAGARA